MNARPTLLVVGGGPAGLTVARLLALKSWPSTLVDPLLPRQRRLELVAPPVVDAFRSAGNEDLLEDEAIAVKSLGICRRWDGNESWGFEPFLTHLGANGYVVDREALDQALRQRAVEAGVMLLKGRSVSVRQGARGFVVRVRMGREVRELSTDLVIDATGRPAAVARRLGARLVRSEVHLATRQSERARLPNSRKAWLNVDWKEADWTYQMEGPGSLAEAWRVHAASADDRTANASAVDASTSHLQPAAGLGWLAVGDAAAAYNPIYSQGLSNALGTAIVVAGALLAEGSITDRVREVYSAAVAESAGAP